MRVATRKAEPPGEDSSPPATGNPSRIVRVRLTDAPGGLTNVVLVFSTLDLPLDRLEYASDAGSASLAACFRSDGRTADLVLRKLDRLIEVLEAKLAASVPVQEG